MKIPVNQAPDRVPETVGDLSGFHSQVLALLEKAYDFCDYLCGEAPDDSEVKSKFKDLSNRYGRLSAKTNMLPWFNQEATEDGDEAETTESGSVHSNAIAVVEDLWRELLIRNQPNSKSGLDPYLQNPIVIDALAKIAKEEKTNIDDVLNNRDQLDKELNDAVSLFEAHLARTNNPPQTFHAAEQPSSNPQVVEPQLADDQLQVEISRGGKSATIYWGGDAYIVNRKTADAFQAMLGARGQPIGIAEHVGRPGDWHKKLKEEHPELAAMVARAAGNRGYRLTIFDSQS